MRRERIRINVGVTRRRKSYAYDYASAHLTPASPHKYFNPARPRSTFVARLTRSEIRELHSPRFTQTPHSSGFGADFLSQRSTDRLI